MQSTVVKSNLSNKFIIFHYIPLFSLLSLFLSLSLLFSFYCKKRFIFSCDTALNSEMCFHLINHPIYLSCVVSFLWDPQTISFVILHFECSTQNFWGGVCVTWQYLGGIWVMFGSLRVTYYTSYTFGFSVNISYLYLFKI